MLVGSEGVMAGMVRVHRSSVPMRPSTRTALVSFISINEVLVGRVDDPEHALPGFTALPRHLYKGLVQTEIVPDGILPAVLGLTKVRILVHQVPVDVGEGKALLGGAHDSLGNQTSVGRVGFGGCSGLLGLLCFLPGSLLFSGCFSFGNTRIDAKREQEVEINIADCDKSFASKRNRGAEGLMMDSINGDTSSTKAIELPAISTCIVNTQVLPRNVLFITNMNINISCTGVTTAILGLIIAATQENGNFLHIVGPGATLQLSKGPDLSILGWWRGI